MKEFIVYFTLIKYTILIFKAIRWRNKTTIENRISVISKPASLRGGDSIQLIIPLLNAAYYNNSFFINLVKKYKNEAILYYKNYLFKAVI
jgi:hypothetical protein